MNWKKGWDKIFKKYQWGKYPAEPLMRFICKNYKDYKKNIKTNTLEIGCGTGANLYFLARENFKVFGIDGSKIAIAKAKKYLKKGNYSAEIKCGDVMTLPYLDNFFDIIIDIECLYANSLVDSKSIIKEVYRVLKPNGIFFSLTFSTKTWGYGLGNNYKNEKKNFTKLKKGALKNDDYGVIRFSSKKNIYALYKIFEIKSLEKVSRTINNTKNLIEEWVVICQKKI